MKQQGMPKFGLSGWGRRWFIVLFLIQLVAIGSVIFFIQQVPKNISGWFPQNPLDPKGLNWDASRDGGKSASGDGTGDLHQLEVPATAKLEQALQIFSVIRFSNNLSRSLEERNHELPRNRDLFPILAEDHITIVLYVHNRPQYLRLVVNSLSKVKGIEETLVVVSHDGFFPEMNTIIEEIRFCQVKQIFATFSPHLFPNSFPGQSPDDCTGNEENEQLGCKGNPDQYKNHRSPRIVSLKHHWWWMMNTVWDGLVETRNRNGHILFIEEDHYILPNAYRAIQQLSKMVGAKCPECVALNLAPVEVTSRGEGFESLVVEKIGNIGYAFNRTVWNWIHAKAEGFCEFDDYNWDITMWAVVYPSFPTAGYTLRGPKASAIHFGKCGLHQGQDKNKGICIDDTEQLPFARDQETTPFLDVNWKVSKFPIRGYTRGFEGWGGWGDKRDQELCMKFSKMYRRSSVAY